MSKSICPAAMATTQLAAAGEITFSAPTVYGYGFDGAAACRI